LAHGVFIFAWAQGDQICTDSYFSGKIPVRAGRVVLLDSKGQELISGLTDDKGSICFDRPKISGDIILTVEAGDGHEGKFTLREADLPPFSDSAAKIPAQVSSSPSANTASPAPSMTVEANTFKAIEEIVRRELSDQLGPIRKNIAQIKQESGSKLQKTVGGLGYIVGLFGLAFWWSGRNLRKKTN
jgi:nickel transport protein